MEPKLSSVQTLAQSLNVEVAPGGYADCTDNGTSMANSSGNSRVSNGQITDSVTTQFLAASRTPLSHECVHVPFVLPPSSPIRFQVHTCPSSPTCGPRIDGASMFTSLSLVRECDGPTVTAGSGDGRGR